MEKLDKAQYDLLETLLDGEVDHFGNLSREEQQVFHDLQKRGLIRSFLGGGFELLPAARSAAEAYRDANARIEQAVRERHRLISEIGDIAKAQSQTSESVNRLAADFANLRLDLEKTADELREYKAQQAEQRETDRAQAVIDKKKDRRNQFLVAAFTVALTLFLEHFCDVVKFAKFALESVLSFFH